jgi:hypothetical protein
MLLKYDSFVQKQHSSKNVPDRDEIAFSACSKGYRNVNELSIRGINEFADVMLIDRASKCGGF